MKLRIRQAIYIILALAALALLILVVTHSQSPESLMNPPEAAGDYKSIQNVIEKTLDEGIILKAPNEGNFTTSITFMDLNGDSENDAIAFYRIKNDDTSSIYMTVLLKSGSKWLASEPVKGQGNDVLEFAAGDLNYDSQPEIVVGWNMFDSKDNNTLSVYAVEDEGGQVKIQPCDSKIYSKMMVADVCGEGRNEILLIKNTFYDESSPANATVYELVDNTLKPLSETKLYAAVSEYKTLQAQPVQGTNVFLLDGVVETHSMITELIYWDKGTAALKSPTYMADAAQISTYREGLVSATDINADNVIEIPCRAEANGGEYEVLTEWKQFGFDKFTDIVQGVCSDNLIFNFPEKWKGQVAVLRKGDVWSFYDTGTGEQEKLFELAVADISEWKSLSANYDKLKIYYGTIYGVKLADTDSALALSKNEIEQCIINIR